VGEIENAGDPVFIRHRLEKSGESDSSHEWLAIVTHHLATVQANGLPEPAYNDSLRQLDVSLIRALQPEDGDKVILVETCHGKRSYYAYVRGIEAVGRAVQGVINKNPEQTLTYRTAHDPARNFARRYITLIDNDIDLRLK